MFDEDRERNGGEAVAHVGQSWREIDRQMRRIAKRRAALDAEEAPVLLAAIRAEVHVHLGYGSVIEYLERALGYAPRTARERVRVAEALEALPALGEALAAGDVCYSAVKELSRVLTAETEDEWLNAVAGCTVREIEDEMRGRRPGDRPGDRPDPSIEPRRLKLELPPDIYALFLEARRAAEHEAGEPMTDAEFMALACQRVLDGERGRRGNQPAHTIAITLCRDCDRGWQETGSKSIELPPAAISQARCDAIELGAVDSPTPAPTTRTIPAAIRRAVLARDHYRCTVPGCRSAQFVDVHHIHHRADGGAHELSNLTTLCRRHHRLAHVGQIHISGTSADLTVTHADGRPYGTPPPPADHSTPAPTPPHRSLAANHADARLRATPPAASARSRAPNHADARHGGGLPGAMATRSPTDDVRATPPPATSSMASDARSALINLGMKPADAARAVATAFDLGPDPTLEALIRAALRAGPRR